MSDKLNVFKVTLSTGKVVLLRELKIKHQQLAAQAASPRSNGDNAVFMMMVQQELLKLLIVKVGDQVLKPIQLEDLDGVFSFQEYTQLVQVLNKVAGGDDAMGKFQIEVVSGGDS